MIREEKALVGSFIDDKRTAHIPGRRGSKGREGRRGASRDSRGRILRRAVPSGGEHLLLAARPARAEARGRLSERAHRRRPVRGAGIGKPARAE